MIPRRLIRTVPLETTRQVENWWVEFQDLHPGWDYVTYRDPIDPADFPLASRFWDRCSSGAQLAGLVRLEALYHHGGVYVDSDVQPFKSFEPLLGVPAFAAWEDVKVVPDAVMGAEPRHEAISAALRMAVSELHRGAWYSGPGVLTALFPGRDDVLLLPPGSFYEVHYSEKRLKLATYKPSPWAFCSHQWHASWLPPEQR